MSLKKKIHARIFKTACFAGLSLMALPQAVLASEAGAPATEPAAGQQPAAGSQDTESKTEKSTPTVEKQADSKVEKAVAKPEGWMFQLRANLGAARTSASQNFKSDRLGSGIFAGRVLPDLEIPLPFLEGKPLTLGASYQSFSGVEASSDSAWSLQAIGAQARVVLSPGWDNEIDLSTQAGLALQRQVSESIQSRLETVKWGFALTSGTFARWPVMESVHLVGGVDLVLGSASWFAVSAGAETNF